MMFYRQREEVVSACRLLAGRGYLAGTGGNVACRIDDEYFAVTPSATDYFTMCPEDICVLRLDTLARVEGDRRPSVERRLHANVFRARPDCSASIHTHQPIASAYTLLGRALEIRDPEQKVILGPQAALVAYAPSGTGWLASALARVLKPDINAYLMSNHGVLCCGPTLSETVARVEALEAACTAFFRDAISIRMRESGEPYLSEVLTLLDTTEEAEFAQ